MSVCTDNINFVLRYFKTTTLVSLDELSSRITDKVFGAMRTNTVRTERTSKRFMNIADKEGITVFPKTYWNTYDKKSTTNPLAQRDIRNSNDFAAWIDADGFQHGDRKVVRHFNVLEGYMFDDFHLQIHFEEGERITLYSELPINVTIGRVKELFFHFVPISDMAINDKRSVETVFFEPKNDYDLTFLQQFTRLKRLDVWGCGSMPLVKPFLPYIEEIYMHYTNIIVKTEDLRKLKIHFIIIDEQMATFISQQSRLLVLQIVKNAIIMNFPSTIILLDWQPLLRQEYQLHREHLADQCAPLNLRMLKTNIKLKTIDWLSTKKIKQWDFNGASREKKGNKWVLKIYSSFDSNLPYLNCKADKCVVDTSDKMALRLIDKSTSKVTLKFNLEGGTEEETVLNEVTDLVIGFKVTESNVHLLAKIFPQFSEDELEEKESEY